MSATSGSDQIEPERDAFLGEMPRPNGLDRAHHAAIALEQAVGYRDDARIGLRGARGLPDRLRDLQLVAVRIERAGRDKGAGGGAADAGPTMHHNRRRAVPESD